MSPEPPTLVISGARWKLLLLSLGAAGFVWLGLWMVRLPRLDALIIGFASVSFFGLCFAVAAIQSVRPPRVILSRHSFTIERPPFPDRTISWGDVAEFFIWSHGRSKVVGFSYVDGGAPDTWLVKLNRSLGCEGSLPTGLSPGPKRVLEIMTAWKSRAETP